MFFQVFFQGCQKGPEVKLKKKSVILVFEVIMQSPKHIFEIEIFSTVKLIVNPFCHETWNYIFLLGSGSGRKDMGNLSEQYIIVIFITATDLLLG